MIWRIFIGVVLYLLLDCAGSRPFYKDEQIDPDYMPKLKRLSSKGYEDALATLAILTQEKSNTKYDASMGVSREEFNRADILLQSAFPNFPLQGGSASSDQEFNKKYYAILRRFIYGLALSLDEFCFLDAQPKINQTCLVRFLNVSSIKNRYGVRAIGIPGGFERMSETELRHIIREYSVDLDTDDIIFLRIMNFDVTRLFAATFGWKYINRLVYYFESIPLEISNMQNFCSSSMVYKDCAEVVSGLLKTCRKIDISGINLQHTFDYYVREKFRLMEEGFPVPDNYIHREDADSFQRKHVSTWIVKELTKRAKNEGIVKAGQNSQDCSWEGFSLKIKD